MISVVINEEKRQALNEAGFRVGTVQEFLGEDGSDISCVMKWTEGLKPAIFRPWPNDSEIDARISCSRQGYDSPDDILPQAIENLKSFLNAMKSLGLHPPRAIYGFDNGSVGADWFFNFGDSKPYAFVDVEVEAAPPHDIELMFSDGVGDAIFKNFKVKYAVL